MSYPNYTNGNITQNQGEPIGLDQQRKLAYALQQQSDQPQGQMISGNYVAPSWTQQLAQAIKAPVGAYLNNDADKKQNDFNIERNKKFAELLSNNKPQQIAGEPVNTSAMPAYTPEQQDRFGSPLQGIQRTPVETTTAQMTQETPEQQSARIQPQMMSYMDTYGNTPALQYMSAQMDRAQNRNETLADRADTRTYDTGVRKELRGNQVEDIANRQVFEKGMQTDQFGHADTSQADQFLHADKSQQAGFIHDNQTNASNHDFTAGQDKLKLAATEADSPTLTTDALDSAAETYRRTGLIPPLGQGKAASALRSSIINRAGAIDKAGGLTALQSSDNRISGKNQVASQKAADVDFAKGKNGNTVRSLNVAIAHLDSLSQLATALNNNDTQALNKIGNYLATQTGKPAPTNFNTAKQMVADEVVKAVVGAGGGVADREAAAKVISDANSLAQLAGGINTYKELMKGQIGGLKLQYENSTGRKDFDKYLTEATKSEIENTSNSKPTSNPLVVVDPNGGKHTFTSAAQASEFKRQAGIQ
jgi:hypothetical protein